MIVLSALSLSTLLLTMMRKLKVVLELEVVLSPPPMESLPAEVILHIVACESCLAI